MKLPQNLFGYVLKGLSHIALLVKSLPVNVGNIRDVDLIPWVGKIPWMRTWQPLQYSCLENPMDRGAWQAVVHGVAER